MTDDGLNAPANPVETAERIKLAKEYLTRHPIPLRHTHDFAEINGNAMGYNRDAILEENN